MIEIDKTIAEKKITLRCFTLGKDYQVIISGGREHVGAVALGQCYKTEPDKANVSALSAYRHDTPPAPLKGGINAEANASVIAAYGHREDELAKNAARKLSKAFCANVAVTAGIHFDDLSPQEIDEIILTVNELTGQLIAKLNFDLNRRTD